MQGESLAQLKRGGKERFKAARKRIGKSLLHELADAWGFMIFEEVGAVEDQLRTSFWGPCSLAYMSCCTICLTRRGGG